MSARITDLALGPQYRPSTLWCAVLLCIGVIAAGVCLGMLGYAEIDRIIHADEYPVDVE